MGLQTVRHDRVTNTKILILGSPGSTSYKEPASQSRTYMRYGFKAWAGKISWRRKQQPTPELLPGESHEQRTLEGDSPWGCKELDMTEVT